MPDPKEHRKTRAEMIAKSHRGGDIQTLARAIVNLYDHVDDLTRKLEGAKRKIKELESRLEELDR
jgi:predicted RNase H-like nuclease (RuvC/YqgF family)